MDTESGGVLSADEVARRWYIVSVCATNVYDTHVRIPFGR